MLRVWEAQYGSVSNIVKRHLGIRGYNQGGHIPGYGGGDKIPALLEQGEFVVRKEVAKEYLPELKELNEGGKYDTGLFRDGRRDGIDGTKDKGNAISEYRGILWNIGRADRNTAISGGTGWKGQMATDNTLHIRHGLRYLGILEGQKTSPEGHQAGGIVYAYQGERILTSVHDVSEKTLKNILNKRLRVKDETTSDVIFPELPGLLTQPFINIAKKHGAYVEMLDDIRTTGSNILAPASVGHSDPFGEGITHLRFSRDFNGRFERGRALPNVIAEYLADTGIHEAGHILAHGKRMLFAYGLDEDQTKMSDVPQLGHFGMNEAFAELTRQRFSTDIGNYGRFPYAKTHPYYQKTTTLKLRELRDVAQNKYHRSLGDMLLVTNKNNPEHRDIAYNVAPSVLFHAQEQGKYEELIQNYNNFVRAILSRKDKSIRDQAYRDFDGTFNQQGGIVRPLYASGGDDHVKLQSGGKIPGYGGGDKVPALLEAGEFVVNKQSANRYHGVLAV